MGQTTHPLRTSHQIKAKKQEEAKQNRPRPFARRRAFLSPRVPTPHPASHPAFADGFLPPVRRIQRFVRLFEERRSHPSFLPNIPGFCVAVCISPFQNIVFLR